MMIMKQLPITTYGMEILRKKTIPVKDVDMNIIETVGNMFYTMEKADGVGLAAPQVDIDKAIAVIDVSHYDEYAHIKPFVIINPVIEESHGLWHAEEGCLSIPGIKLNIPRAEKIYVTYYDLDMNEVNLEADKLLGRVLQHEIDHLNGKLFTDLIDEDEKKRIKRDLRDIKKGLIETGYKLLINEEKIR
ncbi:MAG TPA: peptide deformylase [Bacteroidetes bacterium]|mgnify:CR=1 FL=1|nr:peptide deformylase [Bacteroidota bacterium]HCN38558.1 peptide deformylase [Bacteroidota bacterium]